MEKKLIKSIKKEIASNNKLLKSGKLSSLDERSYRDSNFQLRLDLEEYQSRVSSYKSFMDQLFSLMDEDLMDRCEKSSKIETTILNDNYSGIHKKRCNRPATQGLFSSKEAAKFLGISIETLRRYLKSGKIKAQFNDGNPYLYYKIEDVKEFKATLKPFKNVKRKT
jgi:excisionase family DNA binding protein